MKKILLWSLLAFVFSHSTYGQIRIDSIFIENDTIIPNPMDSIQTLNDTIPIPSQFNFRGISTLDPSVTNVYWRVGIDYDNNGIFSTLYLSDAIPPGSTPDTLIEATGLLELPFGVVLNVSIELTTDPSNFGQSGGYNGSYNKITFPIISTTGGRVAMGNKKKDNTLNTGDCILGASLNNGILDFTVYNWLDVAQSLKCTAIDIEFTGAIVQYTSGSDCNIDLSVGTGDQYVGYTVFGQNGNIITPYTKPYSKFTLLSEEQAKIQIDIGSAGCNLNNIETITVEAIFSGCPLGTESATFCIGCTNGISYFEYSTTPPVLGNIEYLPTLTESSLSINLLDNVTVVTGDTVELVVSNSAGLIRAFPNPNVDIKVEKGAYFWAHKDAVCPLFKPNIQNQEAVELATRSVNLNKFVSIFPNPFSHSFNIELELKEADWVSVSLFDVLGHQRGSAIKEYITAGKTQISVENEQLPSGLYHCLIQIGDKTFTKNIVKVR